MKISTKLTLIIMEIGIIPITLLGYMAHNNSYRRVELATKQQLSTVAQIQADYLKFALDNDKEQLSIFTSNAELALGLQELKTKANPKVQNQMTKSLLATKDSIDNYLEVSLLFPDGQVAVSTNPELKDTNLAGKEYFKKGLIQNDVSSFVKGDSTSPLTHYLAGPVKINGETIGVAVIVTKAKNILEVANNNVGFDKTGETVLVMDDGSGNALFLAPTRFDSNAALARTTPKENQNMASVLVLRQKDERQVSGTYKDYRDQEVIAGTYYLEEYGIGVVVKVDISEFGRPLVNSSHITLFTVITVTTIISIIGASVGKSVARRIKNLQDKLLEEQYSADAKLTTKWLDISEAMLASIGDGVMVSDVKGKVIYTNKAFENMLGWTGRGVSGRPSIEVVPRKDERGRSIDSIYERNFPHILSGKMSPTRTTPYFVRRDKTRFPVSLVCSPIVLNGKAIGVVESFRDITKERAVDRSKTEFVSLAAHQLRTPLTAINWYIELLENDKAGSFNKSQKEYLREVHTNSQRMVDLVNTLLHVSRLELGSVKVNNEELALDKLTEALILQLQSQIKAKQLKLSEQYDKNMPSFSGDRELTNIVFQNLMTNAIKYTPDKGTISVSISTKPKNHLFGGRKLSKNSYCVLVKDSGIGIPIAQQGKIFTKLYRADNAKVNDKNGNGLGLYLVKKVVHMNGGNIWFKSKEGTGTEFYVSFPIKVQ